MSHVSAIESAFVSLDSLAETGGQSLNFIWWIAGILVLAGLVIVFAAVASKRKRAAAEAAPAADPSTEGADPAPENENPSEAK